MFGWRDAIINNIQLQQSSLILVHDLDYLLNDELILKELQEQGFELVRFEASISFRFLYEKYYRTNQVAKLIVYTNMDIIFPYEFERQALSVSIDMQTLFPNFSSQVIRGIDKEEFNTLYTVHQRYRGAPSDQNTLQYIIKNVYKIPYDMIDNEVTLYKTLLSIHYKTKRIPNKMQEFLYKEWKGIPAFQSLPLKSLITSQTFFYNFLEQKWSDFVGQYTQVIQGQTHDSLEAYEKNPLADPDVRRLMSDLFLEGQLAKAKDVPINKDIPNWMQLGIEKKPVKEETEIQRQYLKERVERILANAQYYNDWAQLISLIAEYRLVLSETDSEFEKIMVDINEKFYKWMISRYHTLTSLPPYPKPKMVHHIPEAINKDNQRNERTALIVLDGMSFAQWRVIQKFLKNKGFMFNEQQVFAWVPTLTSVSRQAIFSGNSPLSFGCTIHTTSAEERRWKTFWENHGILKQYVAYQKGLGNERYDSNNILALQKNQTKVYGAVIDIIDQFTHHAVLGEKSIDSHLSMWLESNYLAHLLTDLKEAGFTIYLTSDHGNTKATGVGRVSEGVLVQQKGQRVRVYDDKTLFEDAASRLPVTKWSQIGLPESYHALLAKYGEAFVPQNHSVVTHGGISIEEVIVPFVKVLNNKGSGLSE